MISVIVCTYNQEATIGRTLDSILMQQCHAPIEIIIGEDCSTDSTGDICRRYAEQHPGTIRLFCNLQNKGVVDNYFDCLLAASGEYIADCAGDDFWTDPLKLEKELCIMEQHPDVTLVHTAWTSYNESLQAALPAPRIPFTDNITHGRDMLEAIVTQTRIPVVHLCTALYRRDVFLREYHADTTMFRNKDMGCEDLQVVFVMAYNGNIAYLPDTTLNYSQGQESVSNTLDDSRQFAFVRKVTSLSHYLCSKYSISSKAVDSYFRYRVYALSMHAFRAHSRQLLAETHDVAKMWNTEPSAKTRLLFCVMRHEWLWQLGLALRRCFVTAKRVLR